MLWRYAWLRSSGVPDESRRCIENLAFNGGGLFNTRTDDIMEDLIKKKEKKEISQRVWALLNSTSKNNTESPEKDNTFT